MVLPTASTTDQSTEHYWGPHGHLIANPKWTDELIARATQMYVVERKTAGQIAKELGFATRNAIVGKLARLGIKAGPHKQGLKDYQAKTRIAVKVKITPKEHRPRIQLIDENRTEPQLPIFEPPLAQRRTLTELNNYTCRWPYGEPCQPEFYFCGGVADLNSGKPYCQHHTNRASRTY